MKKKTFKANDFINNNLGNNYITVKGMLSAPYAEHSDDHFRKCLNEATKINRLMIDKSKCDNEKHYQKVLVMADLCLSMAMIERRLGIVNKESNFFNNDNKRGQYE